ncbi:MBL fold metallo-hydrolase [candidate division KSB1 bacterium]
MKSRPYFPVLVLCLLLFAPGLVQGEKLPTRDISSEIAAEHDGIAVWWVGNIGWLIKSGDMLISFDLDLDSKNRKYEAPVPTGTLAGELDISFVTHDHGDHFGRETSRRLVKESGCAFVIPESCRRTAEQVGIPKDRLTIARPGEPFRIKGIKVQPLRALHGGKYFALDRDSNFQDCGYVLDLGGKKILQPGDTVLLEDHLDLEEVDVLFVSPTEHNMHITQSTILINQLNPEHVFPQHFDTYEMTAQNMFWTKGYPDEVRTMLPPAMQTRYHKLKQGELFLIK